ncbi:hypothetical protein CDAR_85141 [Caerostris darwini]|uniref:Uncharacterized protein n=1 Tax=Caerostris darwini TaxID=1538125 RepID=A0AAV4N0T6_9ARAC|nr:hypothetical protein CDAR_85141 [Caerostris darwini]
MTLFDLLSGFTRPQRVGWRSECRMRWRFNYSFPTLVPPFPFYRINLSQSRKEAFNQSMPESSLVYRPQYLSPPSRSEVKRGQEGLL